VVKGKVNTVGVEVEVVVVMSCRDDQCLLLLYSACFESSKEATLDLSPGRIAPNRINHTQSRPASPSKGAAVIAAGG
jgi:hypothetical protein